MVKKFLKLNDIVAYKQSFLLSNQIWEIVVHWDYLAKNTIGMQFIRAIDSIPANIAEGFGRYHRRDKEKFYYNARGSVYEALDWLQKGKVRKLLANEEYDRIYRILSELPKEINSLIRYTESKLLK
ncbi:MAG: four helix bundle protein [Candidatus Levybacteria bacterium]|nr:four helix bundle protein [Candidatus Levybacteria bacterium]